MAVNTSTKAVVLAAGRGSRFEAMSGSKTPKLLQTLYGQPVLRHVLDHIRQAGIDEITIVVGYQADQIRNAMGSEFRYVLQERQLGSGNATAVALAQLQGFVGSLLIMCGDSPLIQSSTIRRMLSVHASEGATITLLTANLENPSGYGRVLRDSLGRITGIVEEKAAQSEQLSITEVNGGAYVFDAAWLADRIADVTPNATGETNLTGSLELAASESRTIATVTCDIEEILGVNTPAELQVAQLLLPDLSRVVTKRKELLEDGRHIEYYSFAPGESLLSHDAGIGSCGEGSANCPN